MTKLNKSTIDKIPIPSTDSAGKAIQVIYRDDTLPGFGLRVGSGGTMTFFVERRVNGRVKRISIGRYGHLTPTQARTMAHELLGSIAMGKDPTVKARSLKGQSITLQAAFDDYLATRKNLKAGTLENYKYSLNCHLSDWLNKRLIDITKDMVEERHRKVGKVAPARANNTMRVLRAVFNHAMAKYEDDSGKPFINSNPVDRISKSRGWYKVEKRRSLLAAHELAPWFQATLQLSREVTRDYLHFLLFTGLRKMEAATLKWSDVSFQAKTFTVTDTKNGDPHTLPLSDFLLELIERRHAASDGSLWVFPSNRHDSHLKEPRSAVTKVGEIFGRPFILHDLRRTFITIAESLDIPAYALKQLLNHRNPNDVTAGYIVLDVERLRAPMNKISAFIVEHIND